ncbi:TetR/AcrR family transcriptional regulator [Clostridium oryzae]|uniref:HTH-type transcriptional regulator AcrR n=1 Tax=Clostridium oryzae TaxID=1450648 RepID=A0A1V4IDD6_9CLOT|nr:TetR/AcrR family transcriptional regulator [Clostridium oryzae]OPJ58018.1 HTH-type transcriptional regulator AcrR [Clostridium oryzae]
MAAEKEQTKEKIINVAYKLFIKQGYDNVTINDICKTCGIVKSTFYYHLKSKEDIIADLFGNICELLYNNVENLMNAENYWEQLWKCFEVIIKFSVDIGYDLNGQSLKININKDIGTYNIKESLTRIAVPIIKRAQEAGEIRNQSPAEELYRASIFTIYGYDVMWCIKKGSFDKLDYTKRALENIYDVAPELRGKTSK